MSGRYRRGTKDDRQMHSRFRIRQVLFPISPLAHLDVQEAQRKRLEQQ